MEGPSIEVSSLSNADGSVTYSHSGYLILASANGPVEVQRRDEIPEEATIEVNIRPVTGSSALKERYLETRIHSTLRQVIKVEEYPRTLIQVTLQIIQEPLDALSNLNSINLIPPLLQASTAALISAALPLFVAPLTIPIAISWKGSVAVDPSPQFLQEVSSVHVFSLTPNKNLLLSESAGIFDLSGWETVLSTAEYVCCGDESEATSLKTEVLEQSRGIYAGVWKKVAAEIVRRDRRWR